MTGEHMTEIKRMLMRPAELTTTPNKKRSSDSLGTPQRGEQGPKQAKTATSGMPPAPTTPRTPVSNTGNPAKEATQTTPVSGAKGDLPANAKGATKSQEFAADKDTQSSQSSEAPEPNTGDEEKCMPEGTDPEDKTAVTARLLRQAISGELGPEDALNLILESARAAGYNLQTPGSE